MACGCARAWPNRGKRFTFQCAGCNRQTSVTSGTVMHGSKLPLTVWFWAAYLVASHSNGLSALQLKSQFGLGSYKTAWLLLAKLRRAMVTPGRSLLDGLVEVDEAALPLRSKDEPPDGGQGRSYRGKVRLACAAEVKGRALCRIRLNKIEDFSKASLHAFIERNVAPGARVKTDGWSGYPGLEEQVHEPQTLGSLPAHIVLPWVHRVFERGHPGQIAGAAIGAADDDGHVEEFRAEHLGAIIMSERKASQAGCRPTRSPEIPRTTPCRAQTDHRSPTANWRASCQAAVEEIRHQWRPHVAGVAETVDQQHGRPLPADANVDGGAVGLDVLDTERLWDRYFTAAPRQRTPSERQYSDRKLRPRH